ncbi:unnamed protein product [Symbiodinium sp. CCMP2592]|nr:unnamed protein product [Symbiodinium sp. CCMP2592]
MGNSLCRRRNRHPVSDWEDTDSEMEVDVRVCPEQCQVCQAYSCIRKRTGHKCHYCARCIVAWSQALADECANELLPDIVDVVLKVNAETVSTHAVCPSGDFKGGFRKVYRVDLPLKNHRVVLKIAKDEADSVCELKASRACPAVFTKVYDSGSMELCLRPHSICNIFFLLSEQVARLGDFIEILTKDVATLVAFRSLQAICLATDRKVKCRDLGVQQWGFRGLSDPRAKPQVLLRELGPGLQSDSVKLVILDANCCIPETENASLLAPRRMSSYWAMVLSLTNEAVVSKTQSFLRSQGFNARRVSENLESSLYTEDAS